MIYICITYDIFFHFPHFHIMYSKLCFLPTELLELILYNVFQLYFNDYKDFTLDVPDGIAHTLIKCKSVYESQDWTYHIGFNSVLEASQFEKQQTVMFACSFREFSSLCLVNKQFYFTINKSIALQKKRSNYFDLIDNWYGVSPYYSLWTEIDEVHLNVMRMYLECSDSYLNWMWETILTSDDYDEEDYQELLISINNTDYSLFLFEQRKEYMLKRNFIFQMAKCHFI